MGPLLQSNVKMVGLDPGKCRVKDVLGTAFVKKNCEKKRKQKRLVHFPGPRLPTFTLLVNGYMTTHTLRCSGGGGGEGEREETVEYGPFLDPRFPNRTRLFSWCMRGVSFLHGRLNMLASSSKSTGKKQEKTTRCSDFLQRTRCLRLSMSPGKEKATHFAKYAVAILIDLFRFQR